ncbi:hypothetical protein EVAR_17571_1 [Eumeta japonica]|uniref:Uncharacterized protein n=1 Tax=Eumeta variegata TaxID=151549 RepID=A0A4C1UDE0_EUMVA|nr:hypothetical protein EVAR_17571_1 [Eumeta japonica]
MIRRSNDTWDFVCLKVRNASSDGLAVGMLLSNSRMPGTSLTTGRTTNLGRAGGVALPANHVQVPQHHCVVGAPHTLTRVGKA